MGITRLPSWMPTRKRKSTSCTDCLLCSQFRSVGEDSGNRRNWRRCANWSECRIGQADIASNAGTGAVGLHHPATLNLFLFAVFAIVSALARRVGVYGDVVSACKGAGDRGAESSGRERSECPPGGRRRHLVALGGIAIGTAASLALTRWMASLLYDVTPRTPEHS